MVVCGWRVERFDEIGILCHFREPGFVVWRKDFVGPAGAGREDAGFHYGLVVEGFEGEVFLVLDTVCELLVTAELVDLVLDVGVYVADVVVLDEFHDLVDLVTSLLGGDAGEGDVFLCELIFEDFDGLEDKVDARRRSAVPVHVLG